MPAPLIELAGNELSALDEYEQGAATYDDWIGIAFDTLCVDEMRERQRMIDKLRLKPDARVLEIGCGTGRDTVLIAERLGRDGQIYAQDLAIGMIEKCAAKFAQSVAPVDLSRAEGSHLPFADGYFDAVYHFGGLNTFTHVARSLEEICRVTREGGRVVVGDESAAPWLRDTEGAKILMHNNPLYAHDVPLQHIPHVARHVNVEWVFGGFFYIIDFDVAKTPPPMNLDIPIPGRRGGTHRTRYYGQLEGVTPEAKQLAQSAAKRTGVSVHDWLDNVVRSAAKKS